MKMNGAKQPCSNNMGNSRFPETVPILAVTQNNDSAVVLGNEKKHMKTMKKK